MKKLPAIMFLLVFAIYAKAQPKIGLTLSGGGAKGLAHIGILKAIDSAGLKIDYITGTSMGSIIGGLYASGYSGDSIENLSRKLDWTTILSNKVSMRNFIMEEKSEYGKYAAELPIINGKPVLPTGILESQELWLKLEEVFYPVQTIRDFDKLSIPFRCIGTNLATGKPMVFSSGSLYKAIRASMAIPGVFSTVEIDGNHYVDGGVVRNFPVKDAIEMGADYTIGISVSSPLKDVESLSNAAKIITQVVFMGESIDRNEEVKFCNRFYEVPMQDYSTSDFDEAINIIDLGIEYGRTLYPQFKQLADSLRQLNSDYTFTKERLPDISTYNIDSISVKGLAPKERKYFFQQIHEGDSLGSFSYDRIVNAIKNAYSFRLYSTLTYDIIPHGEDSNILVFNARKSPMFSIKGGINYNTFTGFMLQGNITGRNWLLPFSRTMLSIGAGDNFRGLFEHLQLLNSNSRLSYRGSVYAEHQEINSYSGDKRIGVYRFRYYSFDNQFINSSRRKWSAGLGVRFDYILAKPRTFSGIYVDGNTDFFNWYALAAYNSFERPFFPKSGLKLDYQIGYTTGAKARFKIYQDEEFLGDNNTIPLGIENYYQSRLSLHHVLPLSASWALESKMQSGINFGVSTTLMNDYFIGGVNKTFRNQITFVGAREAMFSSENVVTAGTALRYNMFGEFYLTGTYNALLMNFIKREGVTAPQKLIHGVGITASYNMLLGPLEFTTMWNNEAGGFSAYINLGFPFR